MLPSVCLFSFSIYNVFIPIYTNRKKSDEISMYRKLSAKDLRKTSLCSLSLLITRQ